MGLVTRAPNREAELGSSAREVKGEQERTPLVLSFLRKDKQVPIGKEGGVLHPSCYGNSGKLPVSL